MIFKRFLTLFFLLACINFAVAQSSKKIKKNEVKSKTEWQYSYDTGKEIKYKSEYVKYNQNGDILEEITYEPDGKIIKRETNKYNSNGDLVENTRYNPDGSIKRKATYKYDKDGLWTERTDYDGNGKITKTEKRIYEYY